MTYLGNRKISFVFGHVTQSPVLRVWPELNCDLVHGNVPPRSVEQKFGYADSAFAAIVFRPGPWDGICDEYCAPAERTTAEMPR